MPPDGIVTLLSVGSVLDASWNQYGSAPPSLATMAGPDGGVGVGVTVTVGVGVGVVVTVGVGVGVAVPVTMTLPVIVS